MGENGCCQASRLPEWFRQEVPDAEALGKMRGLLKSKALHTVCESAHCPNMGECWKKGNATFLILGNICTRSCRFCAVTSGAPCEIDHSEPLGVADAVRQMKLKYVVVTSVTRDDLPDEGALHFARTVRAIKEMNPGIGVEVLVPDFSASEDLIKMVLEAAPEVFGHNLETVRRVSPLMRSGADHDRSLSTLRTARRLSSKVLVKSGFMVGLGETDEEVLEALGELKEAGCDIVTIGQYLAPSKDARHVPVARFVRPETFDKYREAGRAMGLKFVQAGPLVRSSYLADEGFQGCRGAGEALAA